MNGGSGRISRACVARLVRDCDGLFWKTSQGYLPLAVQRDRRLVRFSIHWPISGFLVNGTVYPRQTAVRRTGDPGALLWPTPKAQDSRGGSGQNVQEGPSLTDMVRREVFPTPGANDWKGSWKWGQRRGQLDERIENEARDQSLRDQSGSSGRLSPDWVEQYLMGYPAGWSVIEDND